MLVLARAIQGVGAAIVLPLTLTILSDAVPAERRGLALGAWGAIAGLAIALGPLVGGAIVEGLSWQFIFWVNVPIGIVLVPLAARFLRETYGPDGALDLPGLGLVSTGLFALVWALIHGNEQGWTSTGDRHGVRRGGHPPDRVRGLGGPHAQPDAPAPLLPQPGVLGRERASAC